MSVHQVLAIIWKRFWLLLISVSATLVGAAAVLAVVQPRYEAQATASIDFGRADPMTGVDVNAPGRAILGTLTTIIQSNKMATDVVKRLNLSSDPRYIQGYAQSKLSSQIGIDEWIAGDLAKGVKAAGFDGASVIAISYRSSSPVEAALIANTYLATFEDTIIDMKIAAAQQTSSWLEPQMEKLRGDVEAAQRKLVAFQNENKLLAPGGAGADSDFSPLISTSTDLTGAKAQLLTLQSQISTIDSGQGTSSQQTNLLESPVLSSLKGSLTNVNADLGRARTDLGNNNPRVQSLLASQKFLQDQIGVELGNIRRASAAKVKLLQDQIATLEANYSDQYTKMIGLQGRRDELATLQRDVAFRQEQLDTAQKSAASARMQGQLSFSNVSTLDNATAPSSPTFPKVTLTLALALGAGLALGVILSLIAEALDRRIRVTADLQFATDLPTLGVVSKAKIKGSRKEQAKGLSIPLAPAR